MTKFDFSVIASELFNFMEQDVRKRGIKIIYGSCSRPMKAMYSLMGYEKIKSIKTEYGTKVLMIMRISYD